MVAQGQLTGPVHDRKGRFALHMDGRREEPT